MGIEVPRSPDKAVEGGKLGHVMRKGQSLGCVECAVPGETLADKLGILESRGMWLELVNDGKKQLKDVLDSLEGFDTSIESVQAYMLHKLQMLGAGKAEQKAAVRHVEDTIKMASEVSAKNVVVTVTYGVPKVKKPREKCIKLFKHFGRLGRELDVLVSIEPLGRDKTTFLPSVPEVHSLVRDVGSSHVRLMADTMHIHNNEGDVAGVVRKYFAEISELQLRDTNSRPPGQGSVNFTPLLKIIRKKFRGLICLEYKPSSNPSSDFDQACKFVADFISAVR